MSLICFASQKGSPGTTLTALATAAAWKTDSDRRKLLVEADPSGGVLAVRYQLGLEPGLVTLAAAVRAGLDRSALWNHVQELPGGLPLVVGPDAPDQAHSALDASGSALGKWLAELPDVDVIADIGRLGPDSPAVGFAAGANAVLMVARPVAEQLQPAARRMVAIASRVRSLGWVLIGDGPHSADEIEATYGFVVVGVMPDDKRGAAAIEVGGSNKRIRHSPLARSASSLAAMMANWLHPSTTDQTPLDARTDDSRGDDEPTPLPDAEPLRSTRPDQAASSLKPLLTGPSPDEVPLKESSR